MDYSLVQDIHSVKHVLSVLLLLLGSCSGLIRFSSYTELENALLNDNVNAFSSFPNADIREPLEIQNRIVVTDVKPILTESLEIIVHLQSWWKDERIVFNQSYPRQNVTLIPALHHKLWTPDTYLEPEWNTGHSDQQRLIRLYPDGFIGESRRLRSTIPCATSFVGIENTDHICTTRITSYSYWEDEIRLVWWPSDPLRLKYGAVDIESQITRAEHSKCTWSDIYDLTSSCLEVKLYVTREFKSVMFRLYLPSFMAVMMAWSSFWIHRDETSARIKLGTLVTWTVITQYLSIEVAFPHYLDNVAGNVWMLGCMVFTWISFFLYSIIHVIRRREKARERREMEKEKARDKEAQRTGTRALSISTIHPEGRFQRRGVKGYSVWTSKEKFKLSHIYVSSFTLERWCRIWFGVAFLGFCVLFLLMFGQSLF